MSAVPAVSVSAGEEILSASEDTGDIGVFADDTTADTLSDIADDSAYISGDVFGNDADDSSGDVSGNDADDASEDVSGNSAAYPDGDISGNAVDYPEAGEGSLLADSISDNDIYAPEREADTAYHTVTINFAAGSYPDKFYSTPYVKCFLTKDGKRYHPNAIRITEPEIN